MRSACVAATLILLAGCSAPPGQAPAVAHTRYTGIGTYSPGLLWPHIRAAATPASASVATPADDEHVIVVIDGQTGEVRECGDYSGVCVSFNPWTKAVADGRSAPVVVNKHLAEAVQEERAGLQRSAKEAPSSAR